MNNTFDAISSQWNDFYSHAVQLATALQRIPDTCVGDDAAAHLEGHCVCFKGSDLSKSYSLLRPAEDCNALLAGFRKDLGVVSVNFYQLAVAAHDGAVPVRRTRNSNDRSFNRDDLNEVLHLFCGVERSLKKFRRTHSFVEIRQAKHCGTELHRLLNQLNRSLQEA